MLRTQLSFAASLIAIQVSETATEQKHHEEKGHCVSGSPDKGYCCGWMQQWVV
jgi:hypothetical protein